MKSEEVAVRVQPERHRHPCSQLGKIDETRAFVSRRLYITAPGYARCGRLSLVRSGGGRSVIISGWLSNRPVRQWKKSAMLEHPAVMEIGGGRES